MTPDAEASTQRGIAAAMGSRLGAGPARFHIGGAPAWVDTVYLGAYRLADAKALGGYSQSVGVNEDAEFAIRMAPRGGVWFDPRITSTYSPRDDVRGVARQFFRYGRSRAATVRRHPTSLKPRQLAAPMLVIGLVSPWRRKVLAIYAAAVAARGAVQWRRDAPTTAAFLATLPVMHLAWGVGFLRGLSLPEHAATQPMDMPESSVANGASSDTGRQAVTPRVEPGTDALGSQRFEKGATRPRSDVDQRDGPRQVRACEEHSVA